ncbi:MAG: pyridoxamine 5'-phosphate oxidase family protein [Spirochaetia bacterium]|nr:pyridoxamine 5'-phosphate oxidase family protein [Spirochaetota bacterium]MCX8097368.1 pyridoxamine 5'-phosphate oxidase family protein [Spirochaetota bacterium]MDW8111993.1 pyridoxamine 5'-phosphate oxidase family protein [Spirochaetia bacterium]
MKLSKEAIDFLKEGNGITIVATASEFGIINLSPRFILETNDDKLFFVSGFPNKTLYNLKKNPKVCISKWDNDVKGKVRFLKIKGYAKNYTSGDIYEKLSKMVQEIGFPKPLAITEVSVEEFELYGG